MQSFLSWIGPLLKGFRSDGLERTLTEIESRNQGRIRIRGKWKLNLASNDYLGLTENPSVVEACCAALREYGVGSGASRLVTGTLSPHVILEKHLATFKETPSTLLFPSGYQANLAAVTTLSDDSTAIYSDAHNHASVVDGCRLTKATRRIFPHRDMEALNSALEKDKYQFSRRIVITDSVFSTDGTIAPLRQIAQLCEKHSALLVVDEAHATGVLGPSGRGLCSVHGIQSAVQVATLSKALGVAGGFIACNLELRQYLLHAARSFMYTTAPPPALSEAARAALEIVSGTGGTKLRRRLFANVEMLAAELRNQGWPLCPESHILAVDVTEPRVAVHASQWLLDHGVFAIPFRPPTVPRGKSLLRLTPSAIHTEEQIQTATRAFGKLKTHLAAHGIRP